MKVTPIKDFPYSLDGVKVTHYKKGVAINIPDEVVEKLQEAGGYIEGFEKKVETPAPQGNEGGNSTEPVIELADIKGMKKNFLPVLETIDVKTVEDLQKKSIVQLAALDGISEKIAEQLLKAEVK